MVQWHLANLEYGCAASLGNVSLAWWDQANQLIEFAPLSSISHLVHVSRAGWDQDDEHTLTGDHAVVSDGFGSVVGGAGV